MILKTLVMPGDLVVIDEPEAHLHPENHRLIAHVLVRLANAGVSVIAPTHSSTILQQISNLVRASYLDEDRRERLGLTSFDVISNDKVGIYDFRRRPSGVVVEEIPFNPDDGYAESEFFDVAMDLNNETANIDLVLPTAS
jgi:predicted ATPase